MQYPRSTSAGLLFLLAVPAFSAFGQDPLFFPISSGESGLVVLINGDLVDKSVVVSDEKGLPLDIAKWEWSEPFLRSYELAPGTYDIHLPSPIESVRLTTTEGKLTFLEIARYSQESGEQGIQITSWYGEPSEKIKNTAYALKEQGFEAVFQATRLDPSLNELYFKTDPLGAHPDPWPPRPK